MLTFLKPQYVLSIWMALLSSSSLSSSRISSLASGQIYEQRTSTFDALFKFEPVRGSGNMTNIEIESWGDASSAFFAAMFDQLNQPDYNETIPMLAPGVIIDVTFQDRYVASTGNFGQINYGVNLEVTFLVSFSTTVGAGDVNAADRALRIFDRDNKGNLLFFSPYLSSLRRSVGNTFASVNKMFINVSGPRPVDVASPIPTLPLPPPTDEPSMRPTVTPTSADSTTPTVMPSRSPTPSPTIATIAPTMETPRPSVVPTVSEGTPVPSVSGITTLAPVPVTATPTPTLPPVPDSTLTPSVAPDPTNGPTKNPTAPPTLPIESFFATSKLSLEGPNESLDFNATLDFQTVTANYLSTIIQDLLRDTIVEEVNVGLSSQNVVREEDDDNGQRRHLRQLEDEQWSGGGSAVEEARPSKLLVEFNTILKIRSTSSVNAPSLAQSAFGTAGRRENYRLLLLASQDPILDGIIRVELADGNGNIVNRGDVAEPSPDGGLSTGALIGIGVGAVLFAVAILGIWYKANNRSSDDGGDSQKGQIPTANVSKEEGGGRGRLDAEIVVDHEDDVSTLGDPFFGMSLEERTCADKTATSASVQQSYDFMKLMGKGPNPLLGTTTEADEEDETASKVRRNTLYADDDASFEDMFGEMN
ncbi:MAG: hypothetical protein SGBAC_007438 [Bacillariaceae sp.]